MSPEATTRYTAGELVRHDEVYARSSPLFDTDDERYRWINAVHTVALNQMSLSEVHYKVFEVPEVPTWDGRMSVSALADLAAELDDGVVVTDPDILASHRRTAPPTRRPEPMAVVRPTRTEVQAVLRWASRHRIAVVPRGAGTGLSGGATALDGGIVLSTEKMRDITVDPVTRTAVVQPGLLNAEVKKVVAEHGLWYPPDPSSYEICSIGGNIATNAGGLCCVKYGVTTDYVLGLQVVLADGTAVRLGGPRLKDVAGLSLTKLFVGSEGTLGVVTEVTLRLLPPQHLGVHRGRDVRLGGGGGERGGDHHRRDPSVDAGVHGRGGHQRRRGQTADGPGPLGGGDDGGRLRRPRRAGAEDAEFMARVFTEAGATECFSTSGPGGGRSIRRRPPLRHPGGGGQGSTAARGCRVPLPALAELVGVWPRSRPTAT